MTMPAFFISGTKVPLEHPGLIVLLQDTGTLSTATVPCSSIGRHLRPVNSTVGFDFAA